MPNPFPGMNPYLENRHAWSDFHTMLIVGIRSALSKELPPGFATYMEQRVYIASEGRNFRPDIFAVARSLKRPLESSQPGGTATLIGPDPSFTPSVLVEFERETVQERFVEIRTRDQAETLVAVIELISPTNKNDEIGRREYRRKQRDLLQSNAHFIEIDLLREGRWIFDFPEEETKKQLGDFDYLVSLHRAGDQARYELWPVLLQNRLPTILVPLTLDIPPVAVDLQGVLNHAYDEAGYDRIIDYTGEPQPSLTEEDSRWAKALLTEHR